MRPLRAIVVDDEMHVRADLVRVLESLDVTVVATGEDGVSAIRLMASVEADVVFLDIQMPGLDGLNVVSSAAHTGRALPPIVFVTAHMEHAPTAFDLDACDYVLKPVTKERIQRALARVLRRVRIDETDQVVPRLRVTHDKGSHFVEVRRIEAFRAVEKYVAFDVDGQEHLLRESLDELETRFASAGFVRAHRAHLIRTAAVVGTEDAEQGFVLVMQSGLRVPVSKRLRAQVTRALQDSAG